MNRIKWILLQVLFFGCLNVARSQYYYNEIVATKQAAQQYQALKTNHITHITAQSFEGDNQPTENFKLEQTISPDANTVSINASYPSTGNLSTINTYRNGKLASTEDSSANILTKTTYTYNDAGNIASITTESIDTFMNSHSTEVHLWSYNANGQPSQMLRIKDKIDTTVIEITYDNGNVAQETWKRKGRVVENYYYYYNANNLLTDIVRYNYRAKKMLPDFLFDYDANGRVVKMMQVPTGSSDYMVWQYIYNSNGLKEKELLYNKQQQLVGRIEYSYR
jgi:YD repeat-containing protein